LENKAMAVLRKCVFIGAMLLTSATAFAEDTHHPASTAETPAASAPAAKADTSGAGMMSGGMMSHGKTSEGMSDDMMRMMMGMMSADGGPMEQMMSPDRIEGQIAFLRTELKVTDAQQALWQAVADALRANASAGKGMMAEMPGAMMSSDSAPVTPLQSIEVFEHMLSTRLEGLRQLKAALEPFYAALDDAQKAVADKLLKPVPMGMM
jgi:hypothetical protein